MASNEKDPVVSKTTTQNELFTTSSTDKGEFVRNKAFYMSQYVTS